MTTKELSKLSVGSILLDKSSNTLVKIKSPIVSEDAGRRWAVVQRICKKRQHEHYVPVANLKRIELSCESLKQFGFEENKLMNKCEYNSRDEGETLITLTDRSNNPYDGYKYLALAHKDPSCKEYEANGMYIRFDKNACKYLDELQDLLRILKFKKPSVLVTF